ADHARALLIDDRVERDRGLAGLTVANDQLALTAPDRDHGVDGLDAGLQWLFDRLALDHAGRFELDVAEVIGADRPLAVDGLPDGVDHATDQRFADRHGGDAAGALDAVALLDVLVGAEEHDTDVVLFEVEDHAEHVAGEPDQLARHRIFQSPQARDAV